LSHFYWDEVLQKESADWGKATARTAFPLAMVRKSKRKLFQTQFIIKSKHAIEGYPAASHGHLEPLISLLSDQMKGTEVS
jgi:hypothetical protein